MSGNIVPISFMLAGIRAFNSTNKQALPQRSNRDVVDSLRQARDINGKQYSRLRDDFISNVLFKGYDDCPGIYFFLRRASKDAKFFYIGISGTRNGQARFLQQRLGDHLRTFDYFFFSLAFPENIHFYFEDCIRFYGSGRYWGKMKTYERQFRALERVPFDHIAWVGNNKYSNTDWDEIENYFVARYQPPANGSKLDAVYDPNCHDKCLEVEDVLVNTLLIKARQTPTGS